MVVELDLEGALHPLRAREHLLERALPSAPRVLRRIKAVLSMLPTGAQLIEDGAYPLQCWLSAIVKAFGERSQLRKVERPTLILVELVEHLPHLIDTIAVERDELVPCLADRHATRGHPLVVPSRIQTERVAHWLRPALVDLVKEGREDPPRLEELGFGDEKGLVAARAVEEHALVRVAQVRASELLRVRHVHHDGLAHLFGSDAWLLGHRDDVQGLIWLDTHHEIVLVADDAHHRVVRLRLEAHAELADALVHALAGGEEKGDASPARRVHFEDARRKRRARRARRDRLVVQIAWLVAMAAVLAQEDAPEATAAVAITKV